LTTYDWIQSFLKITIERRAIFGNLENKINTLYLARRKFHVNIAVRMAEKIATRSDITDTRSDITATKSDITDTRRTI
jgi:translation elongation factor EF-4